MSVAGTLMYVYAGSLAKSIEEVVSGKSHISPWVTGGTTLASGVFIVAAALLTARYARRALQRSAFVLRHRQPLPPPNQPISSTASEPLFSICALCFTMVHSHNLPADHDVQAHFRWYTLTACQLTMRYHDVQAHHSCSTRLSQPQPPVAGPSAI